MGERSTHDKTFPQRRRAPSFSSTLLDTIHRSIDESKSNLDEDQPMGPYRDALFLKQSNVIHSTYGRYVASKERMNLRGAVILEDWLEKQSSHSSSCINSTSSSSGSSCGGMFSSSSENESSYKLKSRSKPERTFKNSKFENSGKKQQHQQQKPGQVGGFAKTKLRALKIYGEFNRKVKQPVSPGSRLASFINSIFNSGNVKKAKMCYVGAEEDVSFVQKSKSPGFSASTSFSRSCMSKTLSSARGKSGNDVKRSVSFYPVSVIVGENSQTPNHWVYDNDPSLIPLPTIKKYTETKELNSNAAEKGSTAKAVVVARDCLGDHPNHSTSKSIFRRVCEDAEDQDDEDDADSYSSSDLFELDHIIGTSRYHEELPVYGTTSLKNNKAILMA